MDLIYQIFLIYNFVIEFINKNKIGCETLKLIHKFDDLTPRFQANSHTNSKISEMGTNLNRTHTFG